MNCYLKDKKGAEREMEGATSGALLVACGKWWHLYRAYVQYCTYSTSGKSCFIEWHSAICGPLVPDQELQDELGEIGEPRDNEHGEDRI